MAVFSFHITDDESKRKIKVAIRPLSPNGNISGTVDDIKNSVSQLRLSPTAALVSIQNSVNSHRLQNTPKFNNNVMCVALLLSLGQTQSDWSSDLYLRLEDPSYWSSLSELCMNFVFAYFFSISTNQIHVSNEVQCFDFCLFT